MITILILLFLALCWMLEKENMFRLPNEKINGKETMDYYRNFFGIDED